MNRRNSVTVEALEVRQFLSVSTLLPQDAAVDAPHAIVMSLDSSASSTTTPVPTAGGRRLTKYVGQAFTAKLGEFSFKTIDQELEARITWGDGTHSIGKIVGSYATGEWYVLGTHTYAKAGTYPVGVKVFAHTIGGPVVATSPVAQFTSVFKVNPLVPSEGGRTLTKEAGQQFSAKVAEFTFKTIDLALNADINWGDGKHSVGKLVGSYETGEYYIVGTHTYAHPGNYVVNVDIYAHVIGGPAISTPPIARITSIFKVTD